MPLQDDTYEIIAHRGFSARAPENTIAAMEAAIQAGADSVEWDVQVASCGTPILFHDPHLGRTTDSVGPVRRRSHAQLLALDAGGWFSEAYQGERIPSLAEALHHVRGRVQRVYCEVKSYRGPEDLDRMVSDARDGSMIEHTTFISFDWRALDRLAAGGDDVSIGYIVDSVGRFDEAVRRSLRRGSRLIDFDRDVVLEDPFVVPRARARGIGVAVWTVDEVEVAEELAEAGVRRFTTNEVERLVAWRGRAQPA